jgi:hypothetical protein
MYNKTIDTTDIVMEQTQINMLMNKYNSLHQEYSNGIMNNINTNSIYNNLTDINNQLLDKSNELIKKINILQLNKIGNNNYVENNLIQEKEMLYNLNNKLKTEATILKKQYNNIIDSSADEDNTKKSFNRAKYTYIYYLILTIFITFVLIHSLVNPEKSKIEIIILFLILFIIKRDILEWFLNKI